MWKDPTAHEEQLSVLVANLDICSQFGVVSDYAELGIILEID
jgi:hypothetical protein